MPKDQRDQTSDTLQINESYLGLIREWLKIGSFEVPSSGMAAIIIGSRVSMRVMANACHHQAAQR
jgi:hypothetical protein